MWSRSDISRQALSLAAFGVALIGGLGAGGAASAQTAPFTDWASALKPGANIAVGGIAMESNLVRGPGGLAAVGPDSGTLDVIFEESLSAQGDISSIILKTANRTVSFYKAYGDTIGQTSDPRVLYARASDWSRQALAADPNLLNWKYQSFGVWQTGVGQPTGSIGSASVGALTTGTAVPQVGSADFAGVVGGIYLDEGGLDHLITGAMGLKVNFAAHTADFWTNGMKDNKGATRSDLNMTGSFVGLANYPRMFGTLSTTRLTGNATGQFYGPAAEEFGGAFNLAPKSGTGNERFVGAFGAARAGANNPLPTVPTPPSTAFTTWSDAVKVATNTIPARTVQLTFSSNGMQLTGWANSQQLVNYPATFTVTRGVTNGVSGLSGLTIKSDTGGYGVSFLASGGDTFTQNNDSALIYARSSDWTRHAVMADPIRAGWDYQSFGVWETGLGSAERKFGAASTGALTANLPGTGEFIFEGIVAGIYADYAGNQRLVAAGAGALIDFGAREGYFVSRGTTDRNGAAFAQLDMDGYFWWDGTANIIQSYFETGEVLGGKLTGGGIAQFFGPGAREMGGTFTLIGGTETQPTTFVGGFGLKR